MKKIVFYMLMTVLSTAVFAQTKVILDTDIGSDCDDAGAMAVLHKLADKGEVKILGVIYSSGKNKFGIGVCDAINTYYGRGDLPLGQNLKDDVGDPRDFFSKKIATDTPTYHHDVINSAMDLVSAYKKMLEKEQDAGVTIVTIGHPIGLVHLLRDDEGVRLVESRVSRWVAMGGGGWNFSKNGMAQYLPELLKKWPSQLYLSSYGEKVITGNVKLPHTPKNNPVRTAYESFVWNCLEKGRPSWDQIALLFAVRPQYFRIESHGSVEQTENKNVFWNNKKNNPKHHRVLPKISDAEMRDIIEDLMSRQPDSAKQSG
jgi:inosine-uridine nucleoside N-ribohydrolase